MLIIFDLDDTLIDTSGSITPNRLETALHQMIQAGLVIADVAAALDLLQRLNSHAKSSSHALSEFLELHDGAKYFLEIGLKELYDNISFDSPVLTLDCALDVLSHLSATHQLALVTAGKPLQQMVKMEKAGIDSSFFSKILISEDGNKKSYYQSLIEEFKVNPSQVVVCGDRISKDLTPGKELGFTTVHMRFGRGLNPSGNLKDVDYTIAHLDEIKQIISSL